MSYEQALILVQIYGGSAVALSSFLWLQMLLKESRKAGRRFTVLDSLAAAMLSGLTTASLRDQWIASDWSGKDGPMVRETRPGGPSTVLSKSHIPRELIDLGGLADVPKSVRDMMREKIESSISEHAFGLHGSLRDQVNPAPLPENLAEYKIGEPSVIRGLGEMEKRMRTSLWEAYVPRMIRVPDTEK